MCFIEDFLVLSAIFNPKTYYGYVLYLQRTSGQGYFGLTERAREIRDLFCFKSIQQKSTSVRASKANTTPQ